MSYVQVYRSNAMRALGALTVLICAGAVVALALHGDERVLLRYAGGLLLAAWLVWLAYWRPKVTLDDEGVTLHNIFRTVRVPWSSVLELHSRYGLRVDTPYGSYAAWAVAAPAGRDRLRGGDTEATLMARRRLEKLRGLGRVSPDAAPTEPQVTWQVPAIVGTAVLAALTLVGILLAL